MQKANQMTTQIIVIIIVIGLCAGMLSGLVGIGGGIILVPAVIYFLNYTQHQAQGTSLGVLTLPVVFVAFLKYYHECRDLGQPLDWKVILLLAGGFVIGAYFGSSLALKINQSMLKKIFAVILFYTGFKMLAWDVVIIRFIKNIF
jgi:uncharacterized membrane protein YfcA